MRSWPDRVEAAAIGRRPVFLAAARRATPAAPSPLLLPPLLRPRRALREAPVAAGFFQVKVCVKAAGDIRRRATRGPCGPKIVPITLRSL
jgi:hypothetical protein